MCHSHLEMCTECYKMEFLGNGLHFHCKQYVKIIEWRYEIAAKKHAVDIIQKFKCCVKMFNKIVDYLRYTSLEFSSPVGFGTLNSEAHDCTFSHWIQCNEQILQPRLEWFSI